MFVNSLITHSLFRWLVLISLVYAIYRAYRGWYTKREFTKFDNTVRHWTATISHIQLMIGIWLYFMSPLVSYFWTNVSQIIHDRHPRFFGLEHASIMILAIVIISIGSAKAKRKPTDLEKFKTMAIWYTVGLVLIFVNIPWSFSPLTSRPEFWMFQ